MQGLAVPHLCPLPCGEQEAQYSKPSLALLSRTILKCHLTWGSYPFLWVVVWLIGWCDPGMD